MAAKHKKPAYRQASMSAVVVLMFLLTIMIAADSVSGTDRQVLTSGVDMGPLDVRSEIPLRRVGRRSLLMGAVGVGAATTLPAPALAEPREVASPVTRALGGTALPLPPAVRSRQALLARSGQRTLSGLPITRHGTTYNLAQVVRWLDQDRFAVGRWDGTLSIFEFETAPYVGPLVTTVANSPSATGVQMITVLPRQTMVTSNDSGSMALWSSRDGGWSDLRLRGTVTYDPALGVATSGVWFAEGTPTTLAVGHDSGLLSLWSFDPDRRSLRLRKTVDLRNPTPVNPWNAHVMYGACSLVPSGSDATVVMGSDDGYISLVRVPSGEVLSQTVFNPAAQRGINCVSAHGDKILVANCSVGVDDRNLWYFTVDHPTGKLTLRDSANLLIDADEIQAFNFDVKWGESSGGPCWFAGTEEGVLWMGTADAGLALTGYERLDDGTIGAALDYTGGSGRLAVVIHNLNQFSTGTA
jgi:hypothetical protein